jgi:hypothetical protein
MFKIYDGRSHFYQWDTNQKLIVEDSSITEVHFCNRTDECSLVREVYKEGGINLVNVPDILFTKCFRVYVYGYDGNCTKQSRGFEVFGRSKPADYVYTETEVKCWEDHEERITALEEATGDVPDVTESIAAYAEDNLRFSKIYAYNAEELAAKVEPVSGKRLFETKIMKHTGVNDEGGAYSAARIQYFLAIAEKNTGEPVSYMVETPLNVVRKNEATGELEFTNLDSVKDFSVMAEGEQLNYSFLINELVDGETFYEGNLEFGRFITYSGTGKGFIGITCSVILKTRVEEVIDIFIPELEAIVNFYNSRFLMEYENNPKPVIECKYIGRL